MRRLFAILVVPALLCCSGRVHEREAHAAPEQRPKLAKLVFSLAQVSPSDKAERTAGATLLVQALRGSDGASYWGKLSSESRSPGATEPQGGAVAVITDRSFPTLRVAARARLRDDGLIGVGYSIESTTDAGLLPAAAGAAPQRLSSGSTLDGEVLLSKGGAFSLGEIHDARGAKLVANLTVEISTVE